MAMVAGAFAVVVGNPEGGAARVDGGSEGGAA